MLNSIIKLSDSYYYNLSCAVPFIMVIRHGSHQKVKAHGVGLGIHRVWKLYNMSSMM